MLIQDQSNEELSVTSLWIFFRASRHTDVGSARKWRQSKTLLYLSDRQKKTAHAASVAAICANREEAI